MNAPRLTREEWGRVQEVFHGAAELESERREAFVREALADRPDLVDRVFDLLRGDAVGAPLLDHDLGDVARRVLDDTLPDVERLGRYRVVRPLGRGGMGVVYLVEREDLGRRDALKVLRDAAISPARRARFLREQRTLAGLIHPGIAQLHDADLLPDGTPYFVMEFVDGEPIVAHCGRRALGVRDRLALFRDVCVAVGFAHGRAVIHRDLKPSNILVTGDGAPKLLDFGISKDLDETDDAATRTGMRMMTPAYAAPEQLLGEPVGVFTDVYALGVLLYELLAGRPPFELAGLTPSQAERVVLDTVPPPPSRSTGSGETPVAPRLAGEQAERRPADADRLSRAEWEDLDVLCATAMHRDVGRRYGSVEALIRDVDHFLRREPLEARPDSTAYRLARFSQRHARALSATAVALVILTGTSLYYSVRLVEARDRALVEAERTRRIQAFTENLFQGGDDVAGPADTLRVPTVLERGVSEAGLLSDDTVTQSQMYLTLGTMFGRLGRFDRADSLLRAAHAIRSGLDAGDVAETGVALGGLLVEQGAYAEGEAELREAVEGFRASGRGAEMSGALAETALGRALEGQGSYDEAIGVLRQAIGTLQRIAPGSPEHSASLAALSTTYFYAGRLDEADSLTRAALEIDRRLHGDGHPTIADGLINLAAAEVQRGRYVEAEPYFRDAVGIFEGYHGPDHPETASALRMLGNDLIFQDRLADAEPLLERALAIQERALSPEHPRLANTLSDLAYVRLQAGEYDEAVGLYRRIVGIYETSNGPDHYFVAIGLSNLANALSEGGRLEAAQALFDDAVRRFTATRGADHLDTGVARIKLGRVLLRQDRHTDAEAHLRAGYDIVSAVAAPTVSWLRAARSDLADVYDATGRPDLAERYRMEQAEIDRIGAG